MTLFCVLVELKVDLSRNVSVGRHDGIDVLFLVACWSRSFILSITVIMPSRPSVSPPEASDWLLYILTDSALPTGGFVASSGLESAHQSGFLKTNAPANLAAFLRASAHTFAHSTVGFVRAGWDALETA